MPRTAAAIEAPQFSVKRCVRVDPDAGAKEIKNYNAGMALMVREKTPLNEGLKTCSIQDIPTNLEVQQEDLQNYLGDVAYRINNVSLFGEKTRSGTSSRRSSTSTSKPTRRVLPTSKSSEPLKTSTLKGSKSNSSAAVNRTDTNPTFSASPIEGDSASRGHEGVAEKKAKDKKTKTSRPKTDGQKGKQ